MMVKQKALKMMNAVLWVAQGVLALGFIWAGTMKLFQPAEKLAAMWPWTIDNPELVSITGVLDLLAGIGLVFPALFTTRSGLTVFAAYGAIALMIAASVFHISRGEAHEISINIFFVIIAVFIIWGRTRKLIMIPLQDLKLKNYIPGTEDDKV